MRILFLTNYYPPYEVGGYEQLCRDVAEQLCQRGHEIAVLTSRYGVNGASNDRLGDPIYRLLTVQPEYGRWLNPTWQFLLTRRDVNRRNRRWLRRVIEMVQPDVIFIWNLQGLTRLLAVDAEAQPGIGAAYWLAGYSPAEPDEFWHYWSLQPKVRPWLGWAKAGLRHVANAIMRAERQSARPAMQHVAVVSHFMRNKGIVEGTLPAHTRVIYNGVEVEQFLQPVRARTDGQLNLLLAGRISDDKGVHTAVDAVGYLIRAYGLRDIHLTIAGSGRDDYLAHLRKLIQQFELDNYVTMTGWLSRDQIPALMTHNHILLLPTVHPEPFARVVLEGMAGGLAVIAADTGGTGEIVQHGLTGLLFPAEDSRRLAAELLYLARDDDMRQRLARAGQDVVCRQFGLDRMVDEVEFLLAEAVLDHSVHLHADAIGGRRDRL